VPETSIEIFKAPFPRYYGDLATNPSGYILTNSGVANTSDLILYQYIGGVWKAIYSLVTLVSYLLKEDGGKLLTEDGNKLILE